MSSPRRFQALPTPQPTPQFSPSSTSPPSPHSSELTTSPPQPPQSLETPPYSSPSLAVALTDTPIYTVQASDGGLYNIAHFTFGNLVTYQEIGAYNKLPDVKEITPGEKLWIPLPCSCDEVEGRETVHLAHRVAAGSSFEAIGEEFGVNASTIMSVNKISDPRTLQADQIIDVPLRACSSAINNYSPDYNTRLVNDSYDYFANDCLLCSCSSLNYQLNCTKSVNSSGCSIPMCTSNLTIGDASPSGCNQCLYGGYTNTSSSINIIFSLKILPNSECSSGISRMLELRGSNWMAVIIIFLHVTWLYVF